MVSWIPVQDNLSHISKELFEVTTLINLWSSSGLITSSSGLVSFVLAIIFCNFLVIFPFFINSLSLNILLLCFLIVPRTIEEACLAQHWIARAEILVSTWDVISLLKSDWISLSLFSHKILMNCWQALVYSWMNCSIKLSFPELENLREHLVDLWIWVFLGLGLMFFLLFISLYYTTDQMEVSSIECYKMHELIDYTQFWKIKKTGESEPCCLINLD